MFEFRVIRTTHVSKTPATVRNSPPAMVLADLLGMLCAVCGLAGAQLVAIERTKLCAAYA